MNFLREFVMDNSFRKDKENFGNGFWKFFFGNTDKPKLTEEEFKERLNFFTTEFKKS